MKLETKDVPLMRQLTGTECMALNGQTGSEKKEKEQTREREKERVGGWRGLNILITAGGGNDLTPTDGVSS